MKQVFFLVFQETIKDCARKLLTICNNTSRKHVKDINFIENNIHLIFFKLAHAYFEQENLSRCYLQNQYGKLAHAFI